jgi:hypothetical protein
MSSGCNNNLNAVGVPQFMRNADNPEVKARFTKYLKRLMLTSGATLPLAITYDLTYGKPGFDHHAYAYEGSIGQEHVKFDPGGCYIPLGHYMGMLPSTLFITAKDSQTQYIVLGSEVVRAQTNGIHYRPDELPKLTELLHHRYLPAIRSAKEQKSSTFFTPSTL